MGFLGIGDKGGFLGTGIGGKGGGLLGSVMGLVTRPIMKLAEKLGIPPEALQLAMAIYNPATSLGVCSTGNMFGNGFSALV